MFSLFVLLAYWCSGTYLGKNVSAHTFDHKEAIGICPQLENLQIWFWQVQLYKLLVTICFCPQLYLTFLINVIIMPICVWNEIVFRGANYMRFVLYDIPFTSAGFPKSHSLLLYLTQNGCFGGGEDMWPIWSGWRLFGPK